MTDWKLVSAAMAEKPKREKCMWKKIVGRILWLGIGAIPWEEIVQGLLDIVKRKIRETNITLDDLRPNDILEDIEVFLAEKTGLKIDLDRDGDPGA